MDRIVVGVDGSESSRNALRFAVQEGEQHHIPVLAVHAWEVPFSPVDVVTVHPSDYVDLFAHAQEGAERLLANEVDEAVGGQQNGVTVEQLAIEGAPATVLIETAREEDVIVVGSRGGGSFIHLLLGSVSERVARHAPCPVVIHRTTGPDG
jgi:nucleotide-binding universal stress UspA family protein